MARIIDADSFLVTLQKTDRDVCPTQEVWGYSYSLLADLIEDAPTIERRPTRSQFKRMAVQLGYEPVIHCRECKHYRNHPNGLCYAHIEPDDNERGYKGEAVCVEPEDFCSYGERKNDFVDDNKIGERKNDV